MRWGIVPRKTYVGTIPDDIPSGLLSHYLRGLFDGDGNIGPISNMRISLTNNLSVCNGVQRILSSEVGIQKWVIRLHCRNERTGHETYRLDIAVREETARVAWWLYGGDGIRLTRKNERAQRIIEYANAGKIKALTNLC